MTTIDGRWVHGRSHYNGDVTGTFDRARPYGPNTLGEYLYVLTETYNPETNTTTVQWSANPPEEKA